MFQIGDIVVYNGTDVCRVHEKCRMPFPGHGQMEYYRLKPLYEETASNSTLYVPVSAGEDRLRKAFNCDELRAMLEEEGRKVPWIDNAALRRKTYGELLRSGDTPALIGLIRTVSARREQARRAGKRSSDADEKLLQAAQKRLFPLFRYAMGVEWDEFIRLVGGTEDAAV